MVLTPLGRSRAILEQHKVEGVEGKEQKCILGEGVEEGEVEVEVEAEAEAEVVEGQGPEQGYE